MDSPKFYRRKQAAEYLLERYGFGAERSLAKGAVTGDTPEFHKAGRLVVYTREALDEWALKKIGKPRRSSSDTEKPEAEKTASAAHQDPRT